MATTTNYSWSTPDDTALVKDGAAAIRSLGTAIDTTVFTNAGAAINKSLVDAAGDLIYGTADNTVARLAIGTANQVLKVNSGATAPEWGTAPSGGMTLISTTTLTGASVSLSSIPSTYYNLQLVVRNYKPATDNQAMRMRFNGDSNANRHYALATNSGNNNFVAGTFAASSVEISANNDNSVANGLSVVNFYDYTNTTTWKMADFRSIVTDPDNTAAWELFNGFAYYNQTGVISSLTLFPNSGNFTSGEALLYGVK
jgi:hypothetical protein